VRPGPDRSVGPVRLRRRDLPPQHRDLVPQHEDLRVLGRLPAAQQPESAEHADHDQVQQAESHEPRSWRIAGRPKLQVTVAAPSYGAVQVRQTAVCGLRAVVAFRQVAAAAAPAARQTEGRGPRPGPQPPFLASTRGSAPAGSPVSSSGGESSRSPPSWSPGPSRCRCPWAARCGRRTAPCAAASRARCPPRGGSR